MSARGIGFVCEKGNLIAIEVYAALDKRVFDAIF